MLLHVSDSTSISQLSSIWTFCGTILCLPGVLRRTFFYIALVMQSSLDKSAFAYLSTATNCITYSLACVSEMSLKQPVLFSCLYCLARIEILFSCCSCQLFGAWFYTLNHNKLHNLKQNNIGCSVLWQLKKKKKA